MGLHIESLAEIPKDAERCYWIYILDYGWDEPIRRILKRNMPKLMKMASENDAVLVQGFDAAHFQNEVFSWHGISGTPSEEVFPSIMISNTNPHYFRMMYFEESSGGKNFQQDSGLKNFLLIPLRDFCKSDEDILSLLHNLFEDMKNDRELRDFQINKKLSVKRWPLVEALVLEPNIAGVGLDLKRVFSFLRGDKKK